MAEAVIELDVMQPWSDTADRPGGSLPPAARAVLLVLLVVVVLTGPALITSGSLKPLWRTMVAGGFFWLTPDAAYTVDAAGDVGEAGTRVWFTARDPGSGTIRWAAELTGPLAQGYASGREALVSRFPPTGNLGVTTRVIDTRTGRTTRAYPTAATPLAYLSGDVAILIDRDRINGPENPPGDSEVARTGLDRAHLLTARDLRTGTVRWTKRLPAGLAWSMPGILAGTEGIAGLPAGQDWMLTVTLTGVAEVWNLRTGSLVSRREFGQLGQMSYMTALADAVLVRVDTDKESSLAAYDPSTLNQKWRFRPPDLYAAPFVCGKLVCLQSERSVWLVDPRTGEIVSRVEDPRVRPALPPSRLLVTAFGEQLTLFETPTGRRLSGDTSWRVVDPSVHGPQVVVASPRGPGRALLALLNVTTGAIRPLGMVAPFSTASQCLVAGDFVACEDRDVLQLLRADQGLVAVV